MWFPLQDHTVARKTRFEAPLAPVAVPVAQLGDDIRAGILVEGALEMLLLAATGIEGQLGGHLAQAPDFEHTGDRAWQGIEEPVDHQSVEFVGEGPRRAIVRAGGDLPEVVEVALGVGAPQMDRDAAVRREVVDGEAREHRFGAQDAQRRPWGWMGGLGDGDAGMGDHGGAPFLPEAMCPTHDTVCGVFSTVFFTVWNTEVFVP